MKKLLAIALIAVMLAAVVAPMTVSAAGMILFTDTFDENLIDNWMIEESHFECIDGHLEGYADAVVHQSQYQEEYGEDGAEGNKKWGTGTCFKVDCWAYDFDGPKTTQKLQLWWADNIESLYDSPGRIVYYFAYNFTEQKFQLYSSFEGDAGLEWMPADAEDPFHLDEEKDAPEVKLDMNNPEVISLGMRINAGVIYCYFNNELIFTHNAERGALCGAEAPSAILLWNEGTWCGWDNFVVATADYDLFNEGTVTEAPVVTEPGDTAPAVTEPQTTAIKEVVVTEIGEDGEVVTKIVTEIVTNAPTPDTKKQPTNPQGGAQTGDMAVIVIAVMVVCLGAAIVVKKVND